MCLFVIRKVSQRKILFDQQRTLSGQRKTLSSQRKIWFSFQESGFRETTFQTFLCLFAIRKVGQRKTLSS
jgi:hypothetical protein